MAQFQEKMKDYAGQEVLVKDVNGSSYVGVLKEVGQDYCLLAIAKRVLLYGIAHIVSIEPRMQSFSEQGGEHKQETAES